MFSSVIFCPTFLLGQKLANHDFSNGKSLEQGHIMVLDLVILIFSVLLHVDVATLASVMFRCGGSIHTYMLLFSLFFIMLQIALA